ncbi:MULTISPECIES: DUF411 domain-containing protein [Gammaproteobacteria]|jgi:hypothetical protein|uniref:DUF411 domain-containing protein n=1 Tax=Vreelandella halophila TaxID=86177 RepID=A0A9X4YBG1_9GAMM|nr:MULTISPECIES: DUF411 domain-containing protein [Gammaproteobacteria]KAA8982875.1 DUF411 domain-containing protein [Halospina sp. K52047b]MYL25958.1 DUF411 domain-containing protein [Halomonas utahensis]MYL73480.1 DUF411 domain-containing protein [Halomonas sp. 22501_18_FS]
MRRLIITVLSLAAIAAVALGATQLVSGTREETATAEQANNSAAPEQTLTVFASPTCGCCGDWINHMRDAGFQAEKREVSNINRVKQEAGLPRSLASCHTAFIDGYLIEGHVPASDVKRLLREQPEAAGLSVPRMPVGSPGMEVEGRGRDAFDVILFRDNGEQEVFEHYPAQTSL